MRPNPLFLPPRRGRVDGLGVSALGLGCMGMSEFYGPCDDGAARAVMEAALEAGIRLFDTADIYGMGHNERLLGSVLRHHPLRDRVVIATKGGIVRDPDQPQRRGVDTSPAYLSRAVDQSLDRLGTTIDLYYLHRFGDLGPAFDDTLACLADLLSGGKVGAVGLSEVDAATLRRADAGLRRLTAGRHGIAAVQMEYSLLSRAVETSGVDAACRELGILLIAYSPLCRGLLSGSRFAPEALGSDDFRRTLPRFSGDNLARNQALVTALQEVAEEVGATAAQVALAWVLSRGPHVAAIPGMRSLDRVRENSQATTLLLPETVLARLSAAFPPDCAVGERYAPAAMAAYGLRA